jgi:malate synthase
MNRSTEERILTPEATVFLVDLEQEFGWQRGRLLERRQERQQSLDRGEMPDFLGETTLIRDTDWVIDPVPDIIEDRRVEITGPVDRKMMINALNSGARVFMADFEDATTPTWTNLIEGQANLVDAYERTLAFETADKSYRLEDANATLMVRPRGWHLEERHFLVDGRPMSAALFDFGLYLFHGGRTALDNGSVPLVYLPKLESHLEARLWNEVFVWCQERLGIPTGTVKATVLIETILAAFEMDEILYELRKHAAGLNAGRWDYIFSIIKKLRAHPQFVLPDRAQVTMATPFMEAYTRLLVATCHRRRAHAIGGMAAVVPNRKDAEATSRAFAAVSADKAREAAMGFDGTWVAHPDLVTVASTEFDRVMGDLPNQLRRPWEDPAVSSADLLDVDISGTITLDGVETNVSVALRYLSSWLMGVGAAAIDNLMEDVATAEISRSQIWQWVRHGMRTDEGIPIDESLIRSIVDRVVGGLDGESAHTARKVFEEVALGDDFVEFLTLPAYEMID